MVEQLDYYCGRLFDYLENTEDPRWPGHKLIENTYVIFSSDNGGMEGHSGEIITDNVPLDRGKISAMEGGTRVPLIIAGPRIPEGVQTDVMVNGLDFYPTILSLTGAKKPVGKTFDGDDLAPLLLNDPTDGSLIRNADGSVRDTMVWHFPNSAAQESSIRGGDYKLVRNYFDQPELELYRLYRSEGGKQLRGDIEEAKNLADAMPEKTAALNRKLTEVLTEMKASYPYNNPNCPRLLSGAAGTFSARIDQDSFLITPYPLDRHMIRPEDFVMIRKDKKQVGKKPSRALHAHRAIYEANPDVQCIINAQPVNALAFSICRKKVDTYTIPESYVFVGDVSLLPFEATFNDLPLLSETMNLKTPAAVMENNGVMVVGETILSAFDKLEVLECSAEAIIDSQPIGGHVSMSQEIIDELCEAFDLN
jgi:ribulose-5-phosphate 4-epimerase/fuculose-1-phosphate aldolase